MASGVELATAWVRLVPSMDGVQGEVAKALGPADKAAEESGKKAGGKFSTGMKLAITAASTAIIGGVVKVFQVGMEELKFGEQINAQTDLLIKNTGFTMATSQINDYTLALSKVSGVSEEDLQAAGNNIIKFGNVSEENYKKAVASINDLAATGKDATSVSEGLGKALADPATAAGKLRRMGISLTEQQEAQIAAMVEAGDTAGAQGVILDSLEATYGGMAEATGGTLEGNLNKLNNAFENVAGGIVEMLMPAITGMVEGLQGVMTWMEENPEVVQILAIAIGVLTAAIIAANVAMWAMSLNPIVLLIIAIIAAVVLLVVGIVALVQNWDAVVAWLTTIWQGFVDWIVAVIEGFVSWWNGVWEGFASWIGQVWQGFVSWITQVWNGFIGWIMGVINGFVSWWNSIWSAIGKFFQDVWNNLVRGATAVWDGYISWIRGLIDGFVGWWNGIWSGIGRVIEDVFGGIGSFIGGIWDGIVGGIRGAVNNIIRIVNGLIDGINALIGGAGAVIGLEVKIPRVPMLANGGTLTRSGHVIVGEEGPELLKLPKGAQVNPNYDDLPDDPGGVTFNNYAPLGQSPAQALSQFANRAKGL